jgi:hypothetical protein
MSIHRKCDFLDQVDCVLGKRLTSGSRPTTGAVRARKDCQLL